MKKYALSFLTLTMALSSGAAFGNVVGTAEEITVDIPFSAPSGLTHNIVVENGLLAGPIANNTQLARGTVTLSPGEASEYMNVRFVNGEPVPSVINQRVLSGQDGVNRLQVVMFPGEGFSATASVGESFVITSATAVNAFTYNIKASGDQDVVADTYTVTMSAQRWVV